MSRHCVARVHEGSFFPINDVGGHETRLDPSCVEQEDFAGAIGAISVWVLQALVESAPSVMVLIKPDTKAVADVKVFDVYHSMLVNDSNRNLGLVMCLQRMSGWRHRFF